MAVSVDDVVPRDGWPGSFVAIAGRGFSPQRDANQVTVAGTAALLVEASDTRLLVVMGEGTESGPVTVEVAGDSADGGTFEVLPYPDPADLSAPGAPSFFHGPQHGTPSTNRQQQRVLVLPVFPADNPPPPGSDLLTPLRQKYDRAARFWETASYGSTTWQFEHHPQWLGLPQTLTRYIVDLDHVDAARMAYLAGYQRIVGGGGFVFGAAGAGFMPVLHPAPLSWSHLLGPSGGDTTSMLALLRSGTTLYTGTHGGTFAIYDISSPGAARRVGQVNLGAPVWDIAVHGSTAVVALGPAGVGIVDIANSANPTVTTPGAGTSRNWTTRVRFDGNRIVWNRGTRLQVQSIAAFGGLILPPNVDLKAWITDIAIAGSTCVVATDGRGLVTLELTAGGVLERGRNSDFAYLREVRLAGTRAFAAASEDGLVAIDVANLAAPATIGSLKFQKDANSLIVDGNEAVVAVGSVVLVSVDIADPAAMTRNGPEQATSQNRPMAELRAALRSTIDALNMAVDFDRIFIDALRAWFAATGRTLADLDGVDGIAVVLHSPRGRARAAVSGRLLSGGEAMRFNAAKGLFYDRHLSQWTTPTHELVHWLGLSDVYEERFADGSILTGTAGPWCLTGNSGLAPLFCSERMTDHLRWLSRGAQPTDDVRELRWTPSSQIDETFELVAHGAARDGLPNRYHALRLIVSSGMTYWVEARQVDPAGLPFDQDLPLPAGPPGCVVVIRATDEQSVVDNTFERPLQLMGALQPGQQVVDASRNLIVTAEAVLQPDPLAYRVRVRWNQPIPDNPDGTFDLAITPWSTETYETPDIWVDSTRRNPAGEYEFHEDGDPTRPILSGDRPWVGHDNTIHARVRNTGPQKAEDVWVSCYITRPPGIGDNGEWQILDTKQVTEIAPFGEAIVDFTWRPEVAEHTCMSIAILPKLGEVTGGNNRAQENIAVFDSASSSSHAPVVLAAELRNPFTVGKRIDLRVRRLPDGWHAAVDRSYAWLTGHGSCPVRVVLWTDQQSVGLEHGEGVRLALPAIEGWTFDDDRYRPIGGILAPIRAVPGVTITFLTEAGDGAIYVSGELDPPARDVPIVAELRDEAGRSYLLYDVSDNQGRFSPSTPNAGLVMEPGRYTIQVFTGGSEHAAETESELRPIELPS